MSNQTTVIWNNLTFSTTLIPPNSSQAFSRFNPCTSKTSAANIGYTTFLFFVLLLTLVGNTFVCLTILLCRQLRRQITNYFIFFLAISDIAVGIISLPVRIYTSIHNQSFCSGLGFCMFYILFDTTSSVASVSNLLIIAIDRFSLISFPYRYPTLFTRKRAIFICIAIWVYSHAWSWASAYTWNGKSKLSITISNYRCANTNPEFFTTFIVAVYFIPLAIMGIVYTRILLIALKQARGIQKNEIMTRGQKRRARERKATTTLAIIYGAFVVCWLPNCIIGLSSTLCPSCFQEMRKNHETLFLLILIVFVQVLPILNSAVNPFIYGIHNKQFRSAFRQFIIKRKAATLNDSDNGMSRMNHLNSDSTFKRRQQKYLRSCENNGNTEESLL